MKIFLGMVIFHILFNMIFHLEVLYINQHLITLRFSFDFWVFTISLYLSVLLTMLKNQNRAKQIKWWWYVWRKQNKMLVLFSFIIILWLFQKMNIFEVGTSSYSAYHRFNHKEKVGRHGKKASPEIFQHGEIMITNGTSSQSSSSPMTFIQQAFIRLSFFVHFLSKIFPFLDFVASRDLSSHLYDWSSQKLSPAPAVSLNLNESHHFFFNSHYIFVLFPLQLPVTHWALALPHSIYVVFFLPLLTASSITTHEDQTACVLYQRCRLNSWDECKAEYLVVDGYVKWVSEWVSKWVNCDSWEFSLPQVMCWEWAWGGDEREAHFITELTAWQYFL